MRRVTLQGWLGMFVLSSSLVGLGYVSFRQLSMRGMQAEARLMLSYMQTLQNVYHIEQGQFASFDQHYGANIQGKDNCEQPLGAAQLGFLIRGCHDIKSPAPRYAYRSLLQDEGKPGYSLQAVSGSDQLNRSLVCFSPEGKEFWAVEQNQDIQAIESCW